MSACRVIRTGRAILLAGALAWLGGSATAPAHAAPPAVSLTQRLGVALPLDSRWVEADGRHVTLGELFTGGKPVLLVPGYYTCPQLCGLLMHGVLEAVQGAGADASDARIVGFSIDPDDTPATASARRGIDLAYAAFLNQSAPAAAALPELHLLTGDRASIERALDATGYRVRRSTFDLGEGDMRYDHPAALLIVTPQGRISRYLMGVRFDPVELGAAVADARLGRTDALTDRIALLCAHVDLALGRHSATVLQTTRAIAVLIALALAAWCWRRSSAVRQGRTP